MRSDVRRYAQPRYARLTPERLRHVPPDVPGAIRALSGFVLPAAEARLTRDDKRPRSLTRAFAATFALFTTSRRRSSEDPQGASERVHALWSAIGDLPPGYVRELGLWINFCDTWTASGG